MSTRPGRRKTGGSGPGLFRWGPNGEQPDEIRDNPLLRPCDFCGAAPRQRCRKPSRRGWIDLPGRFHDSRTTPAQPDDPETPPSTATQPRTEPQ